jgi:phage terminase small subunit
MPTPPKPYLVLTNEKKSHRTKSELKQREKGEKELSTGSALREHPNVKNSPVAHKEFKRLNTLLKTIKKNDAIYEGVINRYCTITAECNEFEEMKTKVLSELEELHQKLTEKEIDYLNYLDFKDRLQSRLLAIDKQIQVKRKMLLDIEKENIMTIAAALRSIPKKQDNKPSALRAALNG